MSDREIDRQDKLVRQLRAQLAQARRWARAWKMIAKFYRACALGFRDRGRDMRAAEYWAKPSAEAEQGGDVEHE